MFECIVKLSSLSVSEIHQRTKEKKSLKSTNDVT